MRLATVLPDNGNTPVAAVSVDAQDWISLHAFLSFFGLRPIPDSSAPLTSFLSVLMPRFSEFTRKISDWPEHGRVFQGRGGKTFRAKRFLPPILRPPAFRGFDGFEQHVRTVRSRRGQDMTHAWYEIPIFYFANPNSLVGDEEAIAAPAGCNELDYGMQLGVVIGDRVRNVDPANAWRSVAGFTVINDFCARDVQRAEMMIGVGPAKARDFATAVGPVLVTRDEFADKMDKERISLDMRGRLNGREISRGNSSSLFHTIPSMIAYASRDADLFAGDLIGTGTVGAGCILELSPEHTGGWLRTGDVIEVEIERVGRLRTRITARG